MDNIKTQILLTLINERASDNFAILTSKEVLEKFPENLGVKEEDLYDYFRLLHGKGLIRLKYNDGKSFCPCISSRGKDWLDSVNQYKKSVKKSGKNFINSTFVSSFLGALSGVVLGLLLFLFWRVL